MVLLNWIDPWGLWPGTNIYGQAVRESRVASRVADQGVDVVVVGPGAHVPQAVAVRVGRVGNVAAQVVLAEVGPVWSGQEVRDINNHTVALRAVGKCVLVERPARADAASSTTMPDDSVALYEPGLASSAAEPRASACRVSGFVTAPPATGLRDNAVSGSAACAVLVKHAEARERGIAWDVARVARLSTSRTDVHVGAKLDHAKGFRDSGEGVALQPRILSDVQRSARYIG